MKFFGSGPMCRITAMSHRSANQLVQEGSARDDD